MKLTRDLLLSAAIIVGITNGAHAEEPIPKARTVGEFLALGQVEAARSKVTYCQGAVPSLKAAFDDAFLAYQVKFKDAMAPTLEKIKVNPIFSGPIPPGLADAFASQRDQDLGETRKQDPSKYCWWFLSTLKQTTPESIRHVSEESLSRWQQVMCAPK